MSDRDEVKMLEQEMEMSSGNRFEVWAINEQCSQQARSNSHNIKAEAIKEPPRK